MRESVRRALARVRHTWGGARLRLRRPRWFIACLVGASVVPVVGSGSGVGVGAGAGAGAGSVAAAGITTILTTCHLLGYAVLAILLARSAPDSHRRVGLTLSVCLAIVIGLGIEAVQVGVPWRAAAWDDAAVNALGATAGGMVVVLFRRYGFTRAGARTK